MGDFPDRDEQPLLRRGADVRTPDEAVTEGDSVERRGLPNLPPDALERVTLGRGGGADTHAVPKPVRERLL